LAILAEVLPLYFHCCDVVVIVVVVVVVFVSSSVTGGYSSLSSGDVAPRDLSLFRGMMIICESSV